MSGTTIKKCQGLVSFFSALDDFSITGLPVLLLGGTGRINAIFRIKKRGRTRVILIISESK